MDTTRNFEKEIKKMAQKREFVEGRRGYVLDIAPVGRILNSAFSVEGCFRTMQYATDGLVFTIVARYREEEIGRGHYRKCGPAGRLATVEVIESQGAMVGLIEQALAKREEARLAELAAQRVARRMQLQCSACESEIGYDPVDRIFIDEAGALLSNCPVCGASLSLKTLEVDYQEKAAAQRKQLQETERCLSVIHKLIEEGQGAFNSD